MNDSAKNNDFEIILSDNLTLPTFIVRDKIFQIDGIIRSPGVWFCYEKEGSEKRPASKQAIRISSPLYVEAITVTENGCIFGRLLKFQDTLKNWRFWAMPMDLLGGSCEELRRELLAAGVTIEHQNRRYLPNYLQSEIPMQCITAVTRLGWTSNKQSFVFPDRVIGSQDVYFQSDSIVEERAVSISGNFAQWKSVVALCENNTVLILSICVALAGPLLALVHRDSGGVHLVGDSSTGKSTSLFLAGSCWGGPSFIRSWRATANGMEAVAAQVSDLCLCLDEIGEADSNEVGALVYSLGNGIGKARATRTGIARQSHRWRTTLLSTGESSLSTIMHESGRQPKAGQLIRLLNIPVKRSFGVFDCLNNFANGSQMAHFIKSECAKNYGHAGPELIKFLINKNTLELEARLSKIESEFSHSNPQSARASTRFALFALAGELAIEAGILPWKKSLPLQVCKEMFFEWQKLHGPGLTEDRQILKNVSNYIWRFGDIKFTDKNITEAKPKADRAGWYLDQSEGRVFMFTSEALREAIGFLDFTRGLDSLDQHGWIVDRNPGKRTKGVKICGNVVHLYWIRPSTADNLIL